MVKLLWVKLSSFIHSLIIILKGSYILGFGVHALDTKTSTYGVYSQGTSSVFEKKKPCHTMHIY